MDAATVQILVTSAVIASAVGGVLALLGVLMEQVLASEREGRADERLRKREQALRIRDWNMDRLRDTRALYRAEYEVARAWALGDRKDYQETLDQWSRLNRVSSVDVELLGEDDAARAWIEMEKLVFGRPFGSRGDAEVIQTTYVAADDALTRQMERALRDEPLATLSTEVRADLLSPEALLPALPD